MMRCLVYLIMSFPRKREPGISLCKLKDKFNHKATYYALVIF